MGDLLGFAFVSTGEVRCPVQKSRTLLYRASNLPSANEGKTQEITHVTDALKANGYPSTVISNTFRNMQSREKEKPLVTLDLNLTFMQTTGSRSDPWALIG